MPERRWLIRLSVLALFSKFYWNSKTDKWRQEIHCYSLLILLVFVNSKNFRIIKITEILFTIIGILEYSDPWNKKNNWSFRRMTENNYKMIQNLYMYTYIKSIFIYTRNKSMKAYQGLNMCHRRTHITSLLMLVLRKDVHCVSVYGLLGKTDRNW